MNVFVSPVKAVKPKTKNIHPIALFLASCLIVVTLMQLFAYEDFEDRLVLVGVVPTIAPLFAAFLVAIEVFALPFLLGVSLSPAFRIVSMVCGWIAVSKLIGIAVLENTVAPQGLDAVFGAALPLPVGLWSIGVTVGLGILIAWVSWGQWPRRYVAKK